MPKQLDSSQLSEINKYMAYWSCINGCNPTAGIWSQFMISNSSRVSLTSIRFAMQKLVIYFPLLNTIFLTCFKFSGKKNQTNNEHKK